MTPAEGPHGGGARLARIARDWWALITVAALAGALAGLLTASGRGDTFEAEAILSVSPVSATETQYRGLSVLRGTGEDTRDVETLARLVETVPVATRAAEILVDDTAPDALLGRVEATPIGGSALVSVRGRAAGREESISLANAFAAATRDVLDRRLQEQATAIGDRLRAQTAAGGLTGQSLAIVTARIGELDAVRAAGDPTVSVETSATRAASVGVGRLAAGLLGLVAGLAVGLGAALLADRRVPRARSARHLEERTGLPVLARLSGGGGRAGTDLLALGEAVARDGVVGVAGMRERDGARDVARGLARELRASGRDVALAPGDGSPINGGGEGRGAAVTVLCAPPLERGGAAVKALRPADRAVIVTRRDVPIAAVCDAARLLGGNGVRVAGLILTEGAEPAPPPGPGGAPADASPRAATGVGARD